MVLQTVIIKKTSKPITFPYSQTFSGTLAIQEALIDLILKKSYLKF